MGSRTVAIVRESVEDRLDLLVHGPRQAAAYLDGLGCGAERRGQISGGYPLQEMSQIGGVQFNGERIPGHV